ncbi:alpha/beta fold hydrolase [Nocardioides bigeumensis]|uniref:Alpha/beta hydrolase n=1 Tax=Nocardioides bigeumensis TaxID=433657 RepID=A0ABN2YL03_9ACTN
MDMRASRKVQPKSQPPETTVSEERFAAVADGVELCYQTFGTPPGDGGTGEPLLLIMGLGGPMTWWDERLCRLLVARGFFVIRYDNRDTGRSSRLRGRVTRAAMLRAFAGRPLPQGPAYTMDDLARDAVGLLDQLGLDSAHVLGVSMGGMIAQTMAIEHPDRVRSLTSVMSTTGKRSVGWQHPRLLPVLISPSGSSREAYVARSTLVWGLIGSPAYPPTADEIREKALTTYERGISASGVLRQMMAVLTQPNRGPRLRQLSIPTLVVHGTADRMVHASGGRATAAAVPGAELLLIDGMGHDLPSALFETFADAVRRTADRATPFGG